MEGKRLRVLLQELFLQNLTNLISHDFVVRAVFEITEDEMLHQLHFPKIAICVDIMCDQVFICR